MMVLLDVERKNDPEEYRLTVDRYIRFFRWKLFRRTEQFVGDCTVWHKFPNGPATTTGEDASLYHLLEGYKIKERWANGADSR